MLCLFWRLEHNKGSWVQRFEIWQGFFLFTETNHMHWHYGVGHSFIMSSTTPAVTFGLPEGERRQPRKRRRRAEGRRARMEYLIGGCCSSLWLSRSISSTSRSYDTKLLESNNREKLSPAKHIASCPILSTVDCGEHASECTCVRLCVSPKLRLAVIRSVLNQNSLTTFSDRSNSIIACSEHHTRAVPYLSHLVPLPAISCQRVYDYLPIYLCAYHADIPYLRAKYVPAHSGTLPFQTSITPYGLSPRAATCPANLIHLSASHAVPGSQCRSITHMHHAPQAPGRGPPTHTPRSGSRTFFSLCSLSLVAPPQIPF